MHIFPFDNNVPTGYLAACFNNTSATYKFYWLLSILDNIETGKTEIDKRTLFAGMIANAWYTVNYFKVSFGQQDLIQSTVQKLKSIEGITIDEQRPIIQHRLMHSDNMETHK